MPRHKPHCRKGNKQCQCDCWCHNRRYKCLTCGCIFKKGATSKGYFCSQICWKKNTAFIRNQFGNKAYVEPQKLSDRKLLELWNQFKNTKKSLRSIFMLYGYKRVPPKRLLKILPKGEYNKYRMKNKKHSNAYLFKRGSHYERKAKKELEQQGYLVVKSGGSKGIFDLWALGNNRLKLIQCKATKSNPSFSGLTTTLSKISVPDFCDKEIWIWIDRKGWKKLIV